MWLLVTEEVGTGDQGLETGEDWHDQINFGYGYLPEGSSGSLIDIRGEWI